jgi:hypothetical protein
VSEHLGSFVLRKRWHVNINAPPHIPLPQFYKRYVSLWLTVLCSDGKDAETQVPESFPLGLHLISLKPEIKDGFLTLIVPMLRARHKCAAYTKLER